MNIPDDIEALCLEAGAREDCPPWQRAAIAAYLATGDRRELMYGSQSINPFIEEARRSPWYGFSDALFYWAMRSDLRGSDVERRAVAARSLLPPLPSHDP